MTRFGLFSAALLIGLAPLILGRAAWASLGASIDSIEADRAHLSARMAQSSAAAYSVATLTLPNGGVTREFARGDGMVFALAWQGPSRPDLRQLLGDHFAAFQADNAGRHERRTRRPLTSNRPDLIVHSGGRPGGFHGFALIPQLAPAGFSPSDLQ